MMLEPMANPFKAVTRYTNSTNPGKGTCNWCCANVHIYGFQGWDKNAGEPLYAKEIKANLASDKGKGLLQELLIYCNSGS